MITWCRFVLFVRSIMLFIGTPAMQLIPSMLLSLGSCVAIVWKRPYDSKLSNVLNLAVEAAYLLIYISFFILYMTAAVLENGTHRSKIGYFMIALIILVIVRCLVELVVGLWESYIYIRKFFQKNR